MKVKGHQYRWLAGGYYLENRTFLEVASMHVVNYLVDSGFFGVVKVLPYHVIGLEYIWHVHICNAGVYAVVNTLSLSLSLSLSVCVCVCVCFIISERFTLVGVRAVETFAMKKIPVILRPTASMMIVQFWSVTQPVHPLQFPRETTVLNSPLP